MILQVAADAWRIEHDVDAMLLQETGRTYAGQLQQLGRIIGAARYENFSAGTGRPQPAALAERDAGRAAAVEQDTLGQRVGLHVKIAATERRPQIGYRAAGAPPMPCRRLEEAGAFLACTVEIGIER